ncbi:MAG TPA: GTP-binding protein [Bryobacteraceae bacterium]|nr:GTP-binding protein [Bryobacteraceae bacterium]
MWEPPLLLLVGGFLGAGKTSLLVRSARILASRGLKTAMITNDQAEDLVDTSVASRNADWTDEVAGGCFCCRFDEFAAAAEKLSRHEPDVIFAEPVGSCTDLAATVLRPLRELYSTEYRIGPLSVLVDPFRIEEILNGPADIAYLFQKQLEEADLVCFTKSDLGDPEPTLPVEKPLRFLSAKTGAGVEAWLDEVSSGRIAVGNTSLELDYKRYARAEAALGWLNASIELNLENPMPPIAVIGPLMDEIDSGLSERDAAIAHLKLLDETPSGFLKAAICRNGSEPEIEGDMLSPASPRHCITLNLRAQADPEFLKITVKSALARIPGQVAISKLSAFRPSEPKPQYRYG